MGTARSVLFTVSSILMIVSGILGLVTAALITTERLHSTSASVTMTIIVAALTLVYSVINIVSGIAGAKKYNRRINSSVIIRVPEINLAICIITIVFTFLNGVRLLHLFLMILSGLLIPLLFIYAAVQKSTLK